jgi:hypothetical protein
MRNVFETHAAATGGTLRGVRAPVASFPGVAVASTPLTPSWVPCPTMRGGWLLPGVAVDARCKCTAWVPQNPSFESPTNRFTSGASHTLCAGHGVNSPLASVRFVCSSRGYGVLMGLGKQKGASVILQDFVDSTI